MTDILLDEDTDLLFENGDVVIGQSDDQHKNLLLICNKGSFKENPAACVGLINYVESESPADLLREIRTQFVADGIRVNRIEMENGKLKVDADYNEA